MRYYLGAWKKYCVFSGRARRAEYWWFGLFSGIAILILIFLDNVLGLTYGELFWSGYYGDDYSYYGILYTVYALATILPTLGVLVRRLHDTNRSGLWFFISFVPLIGGLWLFVLTLLRGDYGPNRFGPDPINEEYASQYWQNQYTGDSRPPGDFAPPAMAERNFCPQCGAKLPPESAFCPRCGARLAG